MFMAYGADRMATIVKMNTTDVDGMLKYIQENFPDDKRYLLILIVSTYVCLQLYTSLLIGLEFRVVVMFAYQLIL